MDLQCAKCGSRILGRYYVEADGSAYCFACYRDMHKCMICGGFLKEYREINGYEICTACYKNASYRCSICDMPVKLSASKSGNELVCDFCHEHGLSDQTALEELAAETGRFLAYNLRMAIATKVSMEIVDRIASSTWYARRVVGETEQRGSSYTVRIKRYSAVKNVRYFLAHELAHVWQFEQGLRGGDKAVARLMEGQACWTEGKYAELLGEAAWVEHLRSDPNPVYGDGFRFVAALEAKYGAAAVPGIAMQIAISLKSQD